MRQFIIENQGIQTFLVYHLSEEDILDEVCYDMVHDNQVPGILPTFLSTADGKRCLKFNISSRISLDQFFNGVVNRAGFLSAFSSMISTLAESKEYSLDEQYFLLDSRQIYVNVGTKEAELIYLPIIHTKDSIDMVSFLKNIVFQTQFDPSENANYVAKIIKYLDSSDVFSIASLKDKLDEIIEEDEPALKLFRDGRAKTRSVNFTHSAQPEPAQSDWEGPIKSKIEDDAVQFAETSVLSSNMLKPEEQVLHKEAASVQIEGNDRKKGKRTILNLFAGKRNKKQLSQETETVEAEEAIPVSFQRNVPQDIPEEDERPMFVQAYLARVKTHEHIMIDKQVFKIGKERSFVDYCVMDNPTISRSHANIVMENDEYYIMDMNSKNHTYVNGRMIHSGDKVKLIHGSKLKLSNEEFEFYLQS